MDATIVAALIIGGVSAVAGIVSARLGFRSAKSAKLAAVESVTRLESATATAGDFAYRLSQLQATLEFDDSGNAIFVRRYLGLRSRFRIVDFTLPFSAPVTQGGQKPPTVTSLSPSHQAHFETTHADGSSIKGLIVFPGTLAPEDSLDFEVTTKLVNAFTLTRNAARAAYQRDEWKTEYFAVSLPVPTDLLDLEVQFPPSHHNLKPPPSVVVFSGLSEILSPDEISRTRTGLVVQSAVARVTVKSPKLGLKYGIAWLPPEA